MADWNDRDFMRLAIEEMRESKKEHRDKTDPMVGAVLVDKDGNVLGETHRAGLRVGEHAEYTLIERLLSNKYLECSTLYVTLEPCTARSFPKKPCAERIVSARIKKVFIGMVDPNPVIEGHGIAYLLKQRVKVSFFDPDLMEIIRKENAEFIKQFEHPEVTEEEITERFEGSSNLEDEPVIYANIEDFSPDLIQAYLHTRNTHYEVPSPDLWQYFLRNGFIYEKPDDHSFTPTLAGLLLFGRNLEDLVPQSIVKCEAHIFDRLVTQNITGPLLSILNPIKDFIMRNMRSFTEIEGFKRIEVPEYPWEALREAIVNALVHRDYQPGARILIQMFRDRIVVKSPGLPVKPLTLEMIRTYSAPPYSRNPRIAMTFTQMKFMEERGSGLKRMRDLLVNYGLREPRFTIHGGYFEVTFFGYEGIPRTTKITAPVYEELNDRQKKVVEILQAQERITSTECMELFEVSKMTITRDLKALIELEIIET